MGREVPMGWITPPSILTIAVLFSTLLTFLLATDESTFRTPVVLSITVPASSGEDIRLRSIINDAMNLELEHEGLQVVSVGSSTAGSVPDTEAAAEESSILDSARALNADFAITAVYAHKEDELQVDFRWYDVAEGKVTAAVSKKGSIDLSFDSIIEEAVGEITLSQKERLASLPPPAGETTEVDRSEAKTDDGQAVSEQIEPARTPAEQGTAAEDALKEPIEQAAIRNPYIVPRIAKRLEFSLGAAPFLVLGKANAYFRIGVISSLYADYHIATQIGQLGIGLYAGVNSFRAEGAAVQTDNMLIPIGVDLRLLTSESFPVGFFVHVSGGPAVFTISSSATGRLSKIIPYASAGIGLSLTLAQTLGIAVDTSFAVFFEKKLAIMGYMPSVYFYIRL